MILHYDVEHAFDELEKAIAKAESFSGDADMQHYAQLLDDVIDLREKAQKESAPAVGATEAEKGKHPSYSVRESGTDVKGTHLLVRKIGESSFSCKLEAHSRMELIHLFRAARDTVKSAAHENEIPFSLVELLAAEMESEEE